MSTAVDQHIAKIRTARYHDYTAAKEIRSELEDLLTVPTRARMPNRLLVAPSGNGKTMTIQAFLRGHRREDNRDGNAAYVPIVCVEVDSPKEDQLYTRILDYMQCPFNERDRTAVHQRQVLHQLKHLNVRALIIDEFHNLLGGTGRQQEHFRSVIKCISNLIRIPIIGVGTDLAYNALQADPQLANRFYPLELPRWNLDAEFGRLLMTIRRSWEVEIDIDALASEILSRTDRTIGSIIELLERAAIYSLRKHAAGRIDMDALTNCKYVSPADRRNGVR